MDRLCSNPQCRQVFPDTYGYICSKCASYSTARPPALPIAHAGFDLTTSRTLRSYHDLSPSSDVATNHDHAAAPLGIKSYQPVRLPPPPNPALERETTSAPRHGAFPNRPISSAPDNSRKRNRAEGRRAEEPAKRGRTRFASETSSRGSYPPTATSLPTRPTFVSGLEEGETIDQFKEEAETDDKFADVVHHYKLATQEDWCLLCSQPGHWHGECRSTRSVPPLPKLKNFWEPYARAGDLVNTSSIPQTYTQAIFFYHELNNQVQGMSRFQFSRDVALLFVHGDLQSRVDKDILKAWRELLSDTNNATHYLSRNIKIAMHRFESAIYSDAKDKMDNHPAGLKKKTINQHGISIWTRNDTARWINGLRNNPGLNDRFKQEAFHEVVHTVKAELQQYSETRRRCSETADRLKSKVSPAHFAANIRRDISKPVEFMLQPSDCLDGYRLGQSLVLFPSLY